MRKANLLVESFSYLACERESDLETDFAPSNVCHNLWVKLFG